MLHAMPPRTTKKRSKRKTDGRNEHIGIALTAAEKAAIEAAAEWEHIPPSVRIRQLALAWAEGTPGA